jgi:LCP family protein required for cell wall assembly
MAAWLFFLGSLPFAVVSVLQVGGLSRAWVDHLSMTPGISPADGLLNAGSPGGDGTGPIWNGTERVNILLLGMDCRPEDPEDTCRTDSMLVVSIDPVSRTAGVLSLPRDLWVTIPVSGGVSDRVNTTFVYAGMYHVDGGGPALAKATVSRLLGIPIDYAVRVNFEGFVRGIDSLGGLTIDIPRTLKDDEYPVDADYSMQRIYFAPGLQHLTGDQVLMYARSRHQDSDVYRAGRQQQVLVALRQQVLGLNLLSRLPSLLAEFQDVFQTDLSVPQIIALARLGTKIDASSITLRTVPGIGFVTADGADVLQPDYKGIARAVREITTVLPSGDAARVEILNGSRTAHLATDWANALSESGIPIVRADSAADSNQRTTVITAARGNRPMAEQIAGMLGLSSTVVVDDLPDSSVDASIQVLLGNDVQPPKTPSSPRTP